MMNLGLVFKRSRREWRQLGILTIALCLVTAFFSLAPLYVRAAVQSGLRYEIDTINRATVRLSLNNPEPWVPDDWKFISDQLGALNGGVTRIMRNAVAVPGYQYIFGEPTTELSGRSPYTYYGYAFSNLRDVVYAVEGRLPERLAPPDDPSRFSIDEQERLNRGLDYYSTGEVEVVIGEEVAAITGYGIGTRFTVGLRPDQRVVLTVVGIVAALDEDDPFWSSNGARLALTGQVEDIDLRTGTGAIIAAFIANEAAYTDWLAKGVALPNNGNSIYTWDVKLNSGAINADNLTQTRERLTFLSNKLNADKPDVLIFNPLLKLLNDYAGLIEKVESPIILLAGAVLVMMLYHLVTTVNLVLEQQMGEWSSMSSRGASTFQLVLLQLLTVLALGGVGFIVGPFLAFVILSILSAIGPLASATGGVVPIGGIPPNSFLLSLIAALLAVVILTLPAIPAARRSLAQFKQIAARPPSRPLWSRFFLDVVLILIGWGFIARLLFYVEGDFSQTMTLLLNDPAELIRRIIDSANRAGGLADPLNLLGPALLLTGVALLWLRIFPLVMRLLGRLTRRSNGLTAPLAVWNVERDPGHYAQLVLLLIGTLALGTAALALGYTRDQGSWTVARLTTGGAARIDLRASEVADENQFKTLPSVTGTAALVRVSSEARAGRTTQFALGVDPEALPNAFPETRAALAPLVGTSKNLIQGLAIPADTTRLVMDVLLPAKPSDARLTTPAAVYLWLTVSDPRGITVQVLLRPTATEVGTWQPYSGDLPAVMLQAPLVITRLEVAPFQPGVQFVGTEVFVDNLRAENAAGTLTLVADFETDASDGFSAAGQGRMFRNFTTPTQFSTGKRALWLTFGSPRVTPDPTADLDDAARVDAESRAFERVGLIQAVLERVNIPVVMSELMAKSLGEATRRERLPLEVGMSGRLELTMTGGTVQIPFQIVGIVREFPSFEQRQPFLIMDQHMLLQVVNGQLPAANSIAGPNQIWLETAARQPSPDLALSIDFAAYGSTYVLAWDQYNRLLREPLPAAVAGMLYAGFWVSLLLSLLDFAFYLAVTARRRSLGFAVLRSMGWNVNNIWSLLITEQAAMVLPALAVGIGLGALLAYVILPFLALVGGQTLQIPGWGVLGLSGVLLMGFGLLSLGAASWLRQMNVNQVLRLGEE